MKTWADFKYMEKRKKIFYLIVLILIILVIIFGYVGIKKLLKSSKPSAEIVTPTENIPSLEVDKNFVDPINPVNLQKAINAQTQQADMDIIAQPFVERFGSYNNQDQFKNFEDISEFMTDSLKNWVFNTYVNTLRSKIPSIDEYYAINTKVLSSEIESQDKEKGTATLLLNTQRQELTANGVQSDLYYQKVKVNMIKTDSVWKVDAVYWQ